MSSRIIPLAVAGMLCWSAAGVGRPSAYAQPTPAVPAAPRPPAYGELPADPSHGDLLLRDYFRTRAGAIARASLADVRTAADWAARRGVYRSQLADMLGLSPMPERTELKPVVTGKVEHPEFTVEKLHFQSMPGLYVTGNLYLPKPAAGRAPAILYVCGHAAARDPQSKVSYGNKAAYHQHPAWYARNGYACLAIDTIQLGEIEGVHHGLYREKMWWWVSRGYTPAGVEAWNAIRAIDYLQTRPEVDGDRIGITGRSGGGAYSWWTAALDDRVKAAVPGAGITDLHNHVVDGVVEGHCDCMYMVNTYRWDFAQVAALVSPRPLMISNTDRDPIFPLDGVQRLHAAVRRVYQLQDADDKLALQIAEGGHQDTQETQVATLRWFDRHLRGRDRPIATVAEKVFEPAQLKVFEKLPADELVTKVQERFVPKAPPPAVQADAAAWATQRDAWMAGLRKQTFAAWPAEGGAVEPKLLSRRVKDGIELLTYEVMSQEHVPVRVMVAVPADLERPDRVVIHVTHEDRWRGAGPFFQPDGSDRWALIRQDGGPAEPVTYAEILKQGRAADVCVAVRGVGPTAWTGDERRQTHVRRRFWLLGESLDGMRVWDVRRAIAAVRSIDRFGASPLWLNGHGQRMSGVALYTALFTPGVTRLGLSDLSATHDMLAGGPDLLNVLKVLDVPAAVAMAAERSEVRIHPAADQPADAWRYPVGVAQKLGWGDGRVRVEGAGQEVGR